MSENREAAVVAAEDVEAEIRAGLDPNAGLQGAAGFADAESREILNLLGDGELGGACCGGSCCA
jgi:hypothetical protein